MSYYLKTVFYIIGLEYVQFKSQFSADTWMQGEARRGDEEARRAVAVGIINFLDKTLVC